MTKSETVSKLRIEEDEPPRHNDTKTRIRKILPHSQFVTSCLGDLVVNLFSVPTLDQRGPMIGNVETRSHTFKTDPP